MQLDGAKKWYKLNASSLTPLPTIDLDMKQLYLLLKTDGLNCQWLDLYLCMIKRNKASFIALLSKAVELKSAADYEIVFRYFIERQHNVSLVRKCLTKQCFKVLVYAIPWFQGVFSINTTSDIWGILKYQERYLCQIPQRNHPVVCLQYEAKKLFACNARSVRKDFVAFACVESVLLLKNRVLCFFFLFSAFFFSS